MAEAEEMYMRALRGKEKAWGAEHTSTLITVNNLGNLYVDQGKMAEAEEMYMRALRGYEKAWGAEHTSTLDTVNNLGILYKSQGKMAEAEEMCMRALCGYEKARGPDHADTLRTATNLLSLYKTEAFIHFTHVNARKLRLPQAFTPYASNGARFTLEKLSRLFACCERLLQHKMGIVGRILMWIDDREHAITAFQFYRSSQDGPGCDACGKNLGPGDRHLVCKCCPDVDLCEPCFQNSTSSIDQDDGAFSACATHDFLDVPRTLGTLRGELLINDFTARQWISQLLETTHTLEAREFHSKGGVKSV
jgi:hypothetical protein